MQSIRWDLARYHSVIMTSVWRPPLKCKVFVCVCTCPLLATFIDCVHIGYYVDVLRKRLAVLHPSRLLHSNKNQLRPVPNHHPSNNCNNNNHHNQQIVPSDAVEEKQTTMVIGYKMRIRKPMNLRCNTNPRNRRFVIPCIGLDYLCHLHYERPRIISRLVSLRLVRIHHACILIKLNTSSHSPTGWTSKLYPGPWYSRKWISTTREAETKATRLEWVDNSGGSSRLHRSMPKVM